MIEEERGATADTKTCPMCAEHVKAAALICRFCGHTFDAEESQPAPSGPPVPSRPEGPPPATINANLRPDEAVLVWSPCFLNYAAGTVAITTDRVLFTMVDQTPLVNHRLDVERRVSVGGQSLTMPRSCRPDGTVVIEFPDERDDFHGMNPEVAKEIAATVVPSLAERLFADDLAAQQRLRERQEMILARSVATAPKTVVKVGGCKYLGGISGLGTTVQRGSLVFSPNAIEYKVWGSTHLTLSRPKAGAVGIQGAEQLQQRLAATRMIGLGVLSLAAPKTTRRATSYVTLAVENGEVGIFEVKETAPMALQARLSPWLAEH
jgi:Uncharacterised protein family UPF0547